MDAETGGDLLCSTLRELAIQDIVGVPGTQNIHLFEAFRRASIHVVVPTSELGGAFLAGAIYRTTGRLPLVTTIPGPGFLFALPGVAEARADSAALLHLVVVEELPPGKSFRLQELALDEIARPLVKEIFQIRSATDIAPTLRRAAEVARSGEPGPVLVTVTVAALRESARSIPAAPTPGPVADPDLSTLLRRFAAAQRPLLLVGAGAHESAATLRELVHRLHIPICTTPSARGLISEHDSWCIPADVGCGGAPVVNAAIAAADLVIGIGCKLSHNGTGGFALRMPPAIFVHADSAPEVLGANYPASLTIQVRANVLARALLAVDRSPSAWTAQEIVALQQQAHSAHSASVSGVPRLAGRPAPEFFSRMQAALPVSSVVATDAGLHQQLARAFLSFHSPRSLLLPSDFQSMGFGIPSAIGAALAEPTKPVVAVVGDGGFACSGLELLTVREADVRLTIVIFVDGTYGLIRRHQLRGFGRESHVELAPLDYAAFAASVGASFMRFSFEGEDPLQQIDTPGVRLIAVPVQESPVFARHATIARTKQAMRAVFGSLSGRLARTAR